MEKQTSGRKAAERAAKEAETRLSGVLSAKDSMDDTSRQRLEVGRPWRAGVRGQASADIAPGLHVKGPACSCTSIVHTDTLCNGQKRNSLSMSSLPGPLVKQQHT